LKNMLHKNNSHTVNLNWAAEENYLLQE